MSGSDDEGVVDTSALTVNVVALAGSFVGMFLIFLVGWWFSQRYIWRFAQFEGAAKADWCARITSTVHALIVCTLAIVCLSTTRFQAVTLVPEGSTTLMRVAFSIVIGYFLFDQVVLLLWMMPSWFAFTVHHIVVITPFVIAQFFFPCHSGQFVLLLFLLFELSVIPLDTMAFLEDTGYRDTRVHVAAHVVLVATWFLCRVLLAAYVLLVVWTKLIPLMDEEMACLLPIVICAHIFVIFCVAVFCLVIAPEAYSRLRHGDLRQEDLEMDAEIARGDNPTGFLGFGGGSELQVAGYRDLGAAEADTPGAEGSSRGNGAPQGLRSVREEIQDELLPNDDLSESHTARTGTL